MQILPTFLKYYTFTELKNTIADKNFRWYFPQSSGEPEQYSNLLYYDHQFSEDVTPKLKRILATICTQLGAIAVLRIKINATPKNAPQQDWHTDWQITTQSKTFVIIRLNKVVEFGVESISQWTINFPSNDELRIVNSFKNKSEEKVKIKVLY